MPEGEWAWDAPKRDPCNNRVTNISRSTFGAMLSHRKLITS